MENIMAIANVQAASIFAVTAILCVAAVSTAVGFAVLGGKFIESVARQPEMMNSLQVKFFIIAGLLDAISMIAVVVALIMVFGNPMLGAVLSAISG